MCPDEKFRIAHSKGVTTHEIMTEPDYPQTDYPVLVPLEDVPIMRPRVIPWPPHKHAWTDDLTASKLTIAEKDAIVMRKRVPTLIKKLLH